MDYLITIKYIDLLLISCEGK